MAVVKSRMASAPLLGFHVRIGSILVAVRLLQLAGLETDGVAEIGIAS